MEKPVILCVDDDKSVLDALAVQLENEFGDAYFYETTGGVEEAWEVINDLSDDKTELKLIICDWLMPRTKGDQFLLDVYARWPAVQIIMLSGHADENAVAEVAKTVPHFTFVRKPWLRAELMEIIGKSLNRNA